jgi:hypothetical protein
MTRYVRRYKHMGFQPDGETENERAKAFFSYSSDSEASDRSEDDFSSPGKSLKLRNKLDECIRTICVYLRGIEHGDTAKLNGDLQYREA